MSTGEELPATFLHLQHVDLKSQYIEISFEVTFKTVKIDIYNVFLYICQYVKYHCGII